MRTTKYVLFAATFVLLAGLFAGVLAQGKTNSASFRMPPEPIEPIVTLNAIEVTDGKIGMDNQTKLETVYGYSFLGRTTGAFAGSFTLSMNCTPAIPVPGEASELTGGSWTLPVYLTDANGTQYAGSLYGTIAKGSMNWDKLGNATVYMVLSVGGGTQTWDGVGGYATFAGTLSVDEKTQKTTLDGNLVFNLITPVVEVTDQP